MACIDRIYTDMAVMDVTPGGIVVRELFGSRPRS
jgi:3-oxoadipate CoA-transferase beta subunit